MKATPSILVLEDTASQSAALKNALKLRYKTAEIALIENEYSFREYLDEPEKRLPTVVISDIMLAWCDPAPRMPRVPKEVSEGTFRQGGLRCHDQFRKISPVVPWIYFTILDEGSIDLKNHTDEHTIYVQKTRSIVPLLKELDKYLAPAA